MGNLPLTSSVSLGGIQFYGMGNPQHKVPSFGGNIHPHMSNPYHVAFSSQATSSGMVPLQPFMNQLGGGYYPTEKFHGVYQNPVWIEISQNQYFLRARDHSPQLQLPFMATLNLPYLSKFMNDPVCHDPSWPPVPTKLLSNIPKFEGNIGEDPCDQVTTFHLWFSYNSINDDFVRLRLFQHTLTGVSTKWYIELSRGIYGTFN
jgi:hypothetical protein